jgi:hypothetical protein
MIDGGGISLSKMFRNLFFFLFVLDLLFFGAGFEIPGLGVSSRKVFFLLFSGISFWIYIFELYSHRVSEIVAIFFAILFIFIWVFFIPSATHGNISYAVADALPLAASYIFLLTVDIPRRNNFWTSVRRLLLGFLYAFSFVHVVLYAVLLMNPDLRDGLAESFAGIFDVGIGEDARFVFFTPLDGDGSRIYFGSSFLLLLGLYFVLADQGEGFGRGLRSRAVFAILLVGALWATNTRSLMLGAATMVLLWPMSSWLMRRVRWSWLVVFLLLIWPLFMVFILIPTVDTELLASIGIGRGGSDEFRSEQLYSLLDAFSGHWGFGLGFGANAPFVRVDETPYAYELSILALFMKVGVVGVVFSCVVWAYVLLGLFRGENEVASRKLSALYVLYVSFIVSCFYNPYMFGFFGSLFFLFLLYEFSFVSRGVK